MQHTEQPQQDTGSEVTIASPNPTPGFSDEVSMDKDPTIQTHSEPERDIQLIETVAGHPVESGVKIPVTRPLKQLGVTADNCDDMTILFEHDPDDPGSVPVHTVDNKPMFVGQLLPVGLGGRSNRQTRSVLHPHSGTHYQVHLPYPCVEAIGISPDDELPLISVWAGDGVLGFQRAERTQHVAYDSDVDVLNDLLPKQTARDYRAVVIEGRDPEEWATSDDRGLTPQAETEAETTDPANYVRRNVEHAKELLERYGAVE